MVDTDAVLRAYLVSVAQVTDFFGQRVYFGVDLPSGYAPAQGPALIGNVRGGVEDYTSRVHSPSYQFRSYGVDENAARRGARVLFDALNDKGSSNGIKFARLEQLPQLLIESQTDWYFALCFYTVHFANPVAA